MVRPVTAMLPALAWFLFAVVAVGAPCPLGDMDGNCIVDLTDLGLFAPSWLDVDCIWPACPADMDALGTADMADMALLAQSWQEDWRQWVHIRWLRHASIKIWYDSTVIYVDPVSLTDTVHDATIVLVTHSHGDHYVPADIDKVWRAGTTVVGPQSVSYPGRQLILPGQSTTIGEATVTGVAAYNGNHPKSNNWLGFIIEIAGKRIYVCGDTSRIPEMTALGEIDVAFLCIDGQYNMGPAEAALAAGDIRPDLAIPYHVNNANPQTFASQAPCPVRVLATGQAISSRGWMQDWPLVAHWRFDETAGTIAYDTEGGYSGILSGDPVWQPTGGRKAGAVELDGVHDYLSTPFVRNPASGAFSVHLWVKGGAPGHIIVSQVNGTGTGRRWLGFNGSDGRLGTMLRAPGGTGLSADWTGDAGQWRRVGLVWDGQRRHLYVDGQEVAADIDPLPRLESATGGLYVGAANNLAAGAFWSGQLDDIRIYSGAVPP